MSTTFKSCTLSATALFALAGCRIEAQLPTDVDRAHAGAAGSPALHAAAGSSARQKSGSGSARVLSGQAAAGTPTPGAGDSDDADSWADDAVPQAEPARTPSAAVGGGAVPNALLGGWYASSGGTSIPFDPETGRFGMQNGSGLYYHFAADGSYQKAFQSYASNAGCTTGFHAEESGSLQVSGNMLLVVPDGGEIHYRDNCAPSLDSDRPEDNLSAEQFTWELTANGLRLTRTDGATSVFVQADE